MNAAPVTPTRFVDENKALACVHCGLCLTACPTYLETGNENDSPRGRIYLMRAVQENRLTLSGTIVNHLDRCLGCRACEPACPSGVHYGALLEGTRSHIEQHHPRSRFQRFLRRIAIEKVFPFPNRLKWALLPARWIRAMGAEHLLPGLAREAVALVPSDCTPDVTPEVAPAQASPKRGRVAFIRGCVMSVMFGRTNAATVELLNRVGYDVWTPRGQGCCGALNAHSGTLEQARECARRNLQAFRGAEVEAIITNAAGCGSTLKEYGELLAGDPEWAEAARQFAAKVKDLSEFLVQPDLRSQLVQQMSPWPKPESAHKTGTVTYHDACHLAHAQQITQPPRDLLTIVPGADVVDLPESDLCCGSAGTYNLTQPEMAGQLRARKIRNILETGAQLVVTTNPGCILQIQAGLRHAGAGQVQVLHLAEFLTRAMDRPTAAGGLAQPKPHPG